MAARSRARCGPRREGDPTFFPPLVLQIPLLLLGGLVVAQAVTLALTLILPPVPSPQHGLDAVAAALQGQPLDENRADRLIRKLQADPPDLNGPSWLISDASQRELAMLLNTDAANVRLAFYTPLPFAGTASPRRAGSGVMGQADAVAPVRTAQRIRPGGMDRSPHLTFAAYDSGQGGRAAPAARPAYSANSPTQLQGNGPFQNPGGPGVVLSSRPSAGAIGPWATEAPSRGSLYGPSADARGMRSRRRRYR